MRSLIDSMKIPELVYEFRLRVLNACSGANYDINRELLIFRIGGQLEEQASKAMEYGNVNWEFDGYEVEIRRMESILAFDSIYLQVQYCKSHFLEANLPYPPSCSVDVMKYRICKELVSMIIEVNHVSIKQTRCTLLRFGDFRSGETHEFRL